MKFRSIFFGTPAFAVPTLNALAEISDVVLAVCQPDKPHGRGMTLMPPPVKVRATELGIPVAQPTKLRTGEFAELVRAQSADVAVVIAYGRILPGDVLSAPALGCVNLHASILPKYRGAAPITWAVVRGETETGITLMQMDEGMDTGAMLEVFRTPIDPNETAGELSARISELAKEVVHTGLPKVLAGRYTAQPQDNSLATLAPILKKEDGLIDWNRSAKDVHNHVRGMNPWPGAHTFKSGKPIKVHRTTIVGAARPTEMPPGTVLIADKSRLVVTCGDHCVQFETIQLEGKKPMRGADWVIGRGIATGDRLGISS